MICFTIYGPGSIWHGCWDYFCFFCMLAQVLCIWICLVAFFWCPRTWKLASKLLASRANARKHSPRWFGLMVFENHYYVSYVYFKWRQHDKIRSVSYELGLKQLLFISFALSLSIYHKCSYVRIHMSHVYIYIHSNYIDAYIYIYIHVHSLCAWKQWETHFWKEHAGAESYYHAYRF